MKDDERLSQGLASELDGYFEQFVRAFQDRIYGFTLRLVRSREEAEECTQDAFVRAYRALQKYPSERITQLKLRPWLYQIALNVVRNRVRRPTLATVAQDHADGLPSDADEQPEQRFLHNEAWSRLEKALDDLPARYKTALVLRHVHGLSYAEAAAVLGQPVGTTKSDVHRGLLLLREALESESKATVGAR